MSEPERDLIADLEFEADRLERSRWWRLRRWRIRTLRAQAAALRSAWEGTCPYCEEGTWHRVFVTAAPGWGSVMRCTGGAPRNGVLVFSDEEIGALRRERNVARSDR